MKISKIIPLLLLLGGFLCCKTQNPTLQEKSQTETLAVAQPKSVNVRSETMHYIEKGNGEPIILIHGAISDYNAWALQMDTLSLNHRAIAISRRYAWPNQQPGPDVSFDCTVALHAKDIVGFMEEMKISSAHLIGHSYGAMIALRTTIDHPSKVKSLVLGEPAVETMLSGTVKGDSLINDFRTNFDVAVSLYKRGKHEKAVRQFLITVLGSDEVYDVVPQAVRDGWLQNLVEGICLAETQDLASISHEELSQIKAPVLLIKGQNSPAYFATASDSLNLVLPNSELRLLPNVSHGLQGENPSEFNKLVVKFLNDN
jgi:pimeloyl-ACP methyl ester carboxylesterase